MEAETGPSHRAQQRGELDLAIEIRQRAPDFLDLTPATAREVLYLCDSFRCGAVAALRSKAQPTIAPPSPPSVSSKTADWQANQPVRQCPAPPTVLIVDDNEIFRQTAGAALRQTGYAVNEAENGLAALRHLRLTDPPHLILLDLLMPVMDGWHLRDRLTADPELGSIPVVITTAVGQDYQRENLLGAVAYLPKPCTPHEVVQIVQRQCPIEATFPETQSERELPMGVA